MVNAINIIGIEHVVEERTLFIHYNITLPGRWNLSQALTAYRNIIDEDWLVMFPNPSNPRHTNFPIVVQSSSSAIGTFAWSYDGIRGLGPESFDSTDSFLTQLTIFNESQGALPVEPGAGDDPPVSEPPLPTPRPSTIVFAPGEILTPRPGGAGGGTSPPIPGRRPILPSGGEIPLIPYPGDLIPPDPPGGNGIPVDPYPGQQVPGRTPGRVDPVILEDPPLPLDPFPQGGITTGPIRPVVYPNIPIPDPVYPGVVQEPQQPQQPSRPIRPVFDWIPPTSDPYVPPTTDPVRPTPRRDYVFLELPLDPQDPNVPGDLPNGNPAGTDGRFDPQLPMDPLSPQGDIRSPRPRTFDTSIALTNNETPRSVIRPNATTVGEPIGPIGTQSVAGRSLATAVQPGIIGDGLTPSYPIDITENPYNSAVFEGYTAKSNFSFATSSNADTTVTMGHIDTRSLLGGATTTLQMPRDDIPKGTDVPVFAMFAPPPNLSLYATFELWVMDSQGRTILLKRTASQIITAAAPVTINYNISSYNFVPGTVTVLVVAKGTDDRTIGVASKNFIVRPALTVLGTDSNDRIREPLNSATMFGMPAALVDIVTISRPPERFYVKDNQSVRILLVKQANTPAAISALVVSSLNDSADTYKLDLYATLPEEGEGGPINIDWKKPREIGSSLKASENRLLVSSVKRLKLNDEELYPWSHTVGLAPFATTEETILMCIAPDTKTKLSGKRTLDLYMSNSYALQPTSVQTVKISNNVYTMTMTTPYAVQEVGLVVHGQNSQNLPEGYIVRRANTDKNGVVVWVGVSIAPEEYYSLIVSVYGQLNPIIGKVYTAKL